MISRSRVTRLLALPAAALLGLGLLAGCSDDDATTGAHDVSATQATESPTTANPTTESSTPAGGLTVSDDGLTVSYQGVAGKTALELLLQLDPTAVTSGQGANAFVTTVNGRAADSSAKEFWAFYVNDVAAKVGAGSYVMEDGDVITWKLETF